jgi:cell division protein FtsB
MEAIAMRILTLAITAMFVGAASPAPAQNDAAPNVASRYIFNRVNDGFLRLDNVSGQISFCSPNSVGWACQAVPEDRTALEKEIARLQDEITALKSEIATLRTPPSARKNDDAQIKLPTREDIERARVVIEDAWRRLVEIIVTFQKDMMRKG